MEIRRRIRLKGVLAALILPLMSAPAPAAPVIQQVGDLLVMSNNNVRVEYGLTSGKADFFWKNAKKISAFYSGVTLSSGYVRGTDFSNRTWLVISNNQVAVTAHASG